MIITSGKNPFVDYYDNIARQYTDKTILYKRETSKHEIEYEWNSPAKVKLPNGNIFTYDFPMYDTAKNYDLCIERFMIGFCGKTYHLIKETERGKASNFMYSPDLEAYDRTMKKSGMFRFLRSKGTEPPIYKNFPLELFSEANVPVLAVSARTLILNPNLKDLAFFKVKDPYTTFQEISMFVSGVLGNKEDKTLNISDSDKILQLGFDTKTSFRHPVK
ncbi:MAG TPA: hypothetical protein PLP33_24860 [Leptospiraceae bacterium]|nr:hypothetical protein [Leptospiraceae bacterium]